MRTLTFIVTFIGFGYLAVAGDAPQLQSDSVLRQKIVGTWIVDLDLCKGSETYFADGRFEARAVWNYRGVTNSVDHETGTWGVTNGILIVSVPGAARWKDYTIIRVDDQELVMKWNTKRKGDRTDTTIQKRSK